MKQSVILFCLMLMVFAIYGVVVPDLSAEVKTYDKGFRDDRDGWIFLHIEGEPYERGEQYGYLVAEEYQAAMESYKYMTYHTMGMDYSFFVKIGAGLHKDKIPDELLEEMKGIAAGLTKAGIPATLDDIIGFNAFMEITENWWPSFGAAKYSESAPNGATRGKGRCSAFIATGRATADGKIVIAHETFDDYWNATNENIIVDLVPAEGASIMYQAAGPGFINSQEDWYLTSAGIVMVETSIVGISSYDLNGIPNYVRSRMAMQYGDSIDSVIKIMQESNNGGNAAMWLIGDINTNEIAQLQQGLIYQAVEKKSDGYIFSCNAVSDPRIRNLECSGVGYNDIRRQTGGRRTRFPQLMEKYYGKIDVEIAQKILADTYDVYLKKDLGGGANTICAHYDIDPRYYFSDHSTGIWPDPYSPGGSIDGKVTTAGLAKEMKMWGRWGSADGKDFDSDSYLRENPQWNWQSRVLKSRPSRPWSLFAGKQ